MFRRNDGRTASFDQRTRCCSLAREKPVVELNKLAGEPLEVYVSGKLVARGEAVVINEKFGVRLTDIISPTGEKGETAWLSFSNFGRRGWPSRTASAVRGPPRRRANVREGVANATLPHH